MAGESWTLHLPPWGADKMSGLYAQLSLAITHFRPCTNSFKSPSPSFQFRLFLKLNKVIDHHKENIQSIVWGKGCAKCACLLCYVWIINTYSHLWWASGWWGMAQTIWDKHSFILFITASHLGIFCQDGKLRHQEEKVKLSVGPKPQAATCCTPVLICLMRFKSRFSDLARRRWELFKAAFGESMVLTDFSGTQKRAVTTLHAIFRPSVTSELKTEVRKTDMLSLVNSVAYEATLRAVSCL